MSTLTSKDITYAIFNDFMEMLKKYAGAPEGAVTVLGKAEPSQTGFFTFFVKRDEKAPEGQRLQIATFGQRILVGDLIDSMSAAIEQTLAGSDKPTNYA